MLMRGATASVYLAAASLIALMASTTPSSAITGAGCIEMNDYIRALGTVENGDGNCGMSIEEARRILAAHDREESGAAVPSAPAPTKHVRRKHHRKTPAHP